MTLAPGPPSFALKSDRHYDIAVCPPPLGRSHLELRLRVLEYRSDEEERWDRLALAIAKVRKAT
jgi:hypothetical protein